MQVNDVNVSHFRESVNELEKSWKEVLSRDNVLNFSFIDAKDNAFLTESCEEGSYGRADSPESLSTEKPF